MHACTCVCVCVCLSVCVSVCLFVCLSVCLSVGRSVSLSLSEDYIRRMGCGAGLMLDGGHYSAHTVAVDALWAGVPVFCIMCERLVLCVNAVCCV